MFGAISKVDSAVLDRLDRIGTFVGRIIPVPIIAFAAMFVMGSWFILTNAAARAHKGDSVAPGVIFDLLLSAGWLILYGTCPPERRRRRWMITRYVMAAWVVYYVLFSRADLLPVVCLFGLTYLVSIQPLQQQEA